jgi:hypothetical protein
VILGFDLSIGSVVFTVVVVVDVVDVDFGFGVVVVVVSAEVLAIATNVIDVTSIKVSAKIVDNTIIGRCIMLSNSTPCL